MREPYRAGPGITTLPSDLPIPDLGLQPVNGYLAAGREPVLVDSGMPVDSAAFEAMLWTHVDPDDLRWVVVTHDDRDHTGALMRILRAAPRARLVTSPVSAVRLTEEFSLPEGRVVTANPGGRLETADRVLSFHRPPVFDSPGTLAVLDSATGSLFASDSFGTVLPGPAEHPFDHGEERFFSGFSVLNRAIAPWTAMVDQKRFETAVEELRGLRPRRMLSAHSPPMEGELDRLFSAMAELPLLPPWLPEADLEGALDASTP